MAAFSNNYVVGKGRLMFQPFPLNSRVAATGIGFKYFGNTPTLEITRAATGLDHMDSDNGVKVIDDSIDIESKLTGKFSTDNVNGDNLAIFFGGTKYASTQTAGSVLTEVILGALPDNYYQIGAIPGDPSGLRGVTGFSITTGTGGSPPALVSGIDYTFDSPSGLLYIVPGGAVSAATQLNLSYTVASGAQELVIEQGNAVFGALKFLATNPKGQLRDYFWPYCKVTADGTYALKGDTWQTMSFSFEAMLKDSLTRRQYVDLRSTN